MLRKCVVALACAALVHAPAVLAYPTKPVSIVVSVPAGGSIDAIARAIAQHLTHKLGRQVVVENRPGANGNIAADYVRRADADGHTLLMLASSTFTLGPFIYEKLGFDPIRDFTPVAMTAGLNMALLVNPKAGAGDFKALLAKMKEKPGAFNYGSSGNGSFPHVAGTLLGMETGTTATHVPYKGQAPAVNDLLAGQLDMLFDSGSAQHVHAGRLKAVAVIGPQRSQALPDVPTFRELGLPKMEAVAGWHGVFAPAGTPANVVQTLNTEINVALRTPELANRIRTMGLESVTRTPAELGEALKTDLARLGPIVKQAGITAY